MESKLSLNISSIKEVINNNNNNNLFTQKIKIINIRGLFCL